MGLTSASGMNASSAPSRLYTLRSRTRVRVVGLSPLSARETVDRSSAALTAASS